MQRFVFIVVGVVACCVQALPAQTRKGELIAPNVWRIANDERLYAVPLDTLFIAAGQAVAKNWTVTTVSKDIGTIAFSVGATFGAQAGWQGSVLCSADSDGRTRVRVAVQSGPRQRGLFQPGKGGIETTFWKSLDEQLRETGALPPAGKKGG